MKKQCMALVEAGANSPQVLIQFRPLNLGLAFSCCSSRLAVQVGPLAVAVHFSKPVFFARAEIKFGRIIKAWYK